MASLFTNEGKRSIFSAETDLSSGGDDIRGALVMTNTTSDTENDGITTIAGYTTFDEFDGSGYSSPGVALANEAVNKDDANDRAEFDADDAAYGALGNGTRAIQGVMVYKFVTNLNSSLPLGFVEFSANQNPGGSSFTIQWNAEGIFQLT